MSKVKKLLGTGCLTSLALLIGLGGILWIRGNAVPQYKMPELRLPAPNAYDTLKVAKRLEVGNIGDTAIAPAKRFDEKLKKSVPKLPQPLEGRRALLEKNQAAIVKVREALCQDYAAPVKYGDQGMDSSNELANHRELARMLSFASSTYADLGQKEKAVECAVVGVELGMLVTHRSLLIGGLVGMACEAIARKPLWELADTLDAKIARVAVARLEALESKRYPFYSVLLNERDYFQSNAFVLFKDNTWQIAKVYIGQADAAFSLTQSFQTSEQPRSESENQAKQLMAQAWLTGQLVWYTKRGIFAETGRYMAELAEQSKLPYNPKRPDPRMPNDPLNAMLMPVFTQAGQKDTAARAETALVRVYLALRAFRLERGAYPAALQELVSAGYLKALPDDPFAPRFGQTFGYRREAGDRFTLWSCGPDGDDDKGRAIVAKSENGTTRSGHYVQSGDEGDLVARMNTY